MKHRKFKEFRIDLDNIDSYKCYFDNNNTLPFVICIWMKRNVSLSDAKFSIGWGGNDKEAYDNHVKFLDDYFCINKPEKLKL